jgi:superfamily II DNA or RNA helicase
MNSVIKGSNYENDVLSNLLLTHEEAYLWNKIPLDVFIKSNFFKSYNDKLKFRRKCRDSTNSHTVSDTGCDIYYYNVDKEEWVIVQCKNYTNTITLDKLAGFYQMLLLTGLYGELYYTSALSEPITRYYNEDNDKVKFIHHPYGNEEKINNDEIKHARLIPYAYQREAVNQLTPHRRSTLALPPGTGKTLTSILWAERFKIIIVFSPLMAHAKQNLQRFKNDLNDDYEYLLIDSAGTRNINQIKPYLKKKVVLSVTYKSHDIIHKLLKFIKNDEDVGIVIDEFHNLTSDNMTNEEDMFNQIFKKNYNFLFVSATPRVYDVNIDVEAVANDNEDNEDDDYLNNEIENESITGNFVYKMEAGEAIKNKLICDYDVFVPDVTINNTDELEGVYKHLNINDLSNVDTDAKAHFLFRCMEENGHAKCICYAQNVEDAKNLITSFNRVKEYHALEIYLGLIVSNTKQDEREKTLKEFSETSMKAIICSVRILDECIDIPSCDSVFITTKQTNKLRTIQRVSRSNRIDKKNPNKRSGIYMWMNDNDDIVNLIVNLKDFDSSFTSEKVKICNIRDNTIQCVKSRKVAENEQLYKTLDQCLIGITKVRTFFDRIEEAKKYINENKCGPPRRSKDNKIRNMGLWLYTVNQNYLLKKGMMTNQKIYNTWTQFVVEYGKYVFRDNKRQANIKKLKAYLTKHGKLPPIYRADPEDTKLRAWYEKQKQQYKTKTRAMADEKNYNQWTELLNEFKYILTPQNVKNKQIWLKKVILFENYLKENDEIPSRYSKNKKIKQLHQWYDAQQTAYKKKSGVFKHNDVCQIWTDIKIKYKHLFNNKKENDI